MSIVDEGSVLILGAGSSVDFGLPLGGQLIDDIKSVVLKRTQSTDSWGDTVNLPSRWDASLIQRPQEGLKNPIGAILSYQYLRDRHNYTRAELYEKRTEAFLFGQELDGQTSDTIDDFISLNPRHADTAKKCIAAVFGERLFTCAEQGGRVFPLDFRSRLCPDKKTRNWIHLLINIVRHNFRAGPPTEKVKIITFNYDGILERVLAKQFSNVEEQFGSYSDYFEIIHPHGYCGDILDEYDNVWKALTEWAANISVVNEPPSKVPQIVTEARARARQLIEGADHIYAAGFAFARPNCKLLGLDKKDRVKITYHNFNNDIAMDLAVDAIVARWGIRASDKAKWICKGAGSEGRPLPIAEWIRAGFLGEMPG